MYFSMILLCIDRNFITKYLNSFEFTPTEPLGSLFAVMFLSRIKHCIEERAYLYYERKFFFDSSILVIASLIVSFLYSATKTFSTRPGCFQKRAKITSWRLVQYKRSN